MITKLKKYKSLYVVSCFFVLPLILIFFLYKLTNKHSNKEKNIFDQYMYDLIKNYIVFDKISFYKAILYHEKRMMFNKTKWHYRLIIISSLLFFILFKNDFFSFVSNCYCLIPSLKWPTVYETNQALLNNSNNHLINLPNDFVVSLFPIIVFNYIDFTSIVFYCSIAYNLILFICGFFIVKACASCFYRLIRASKVCKGLYDKKKKKKKKESNIINYSSIINSPIPNQEKYQRNMR